MTIVNRLLRGVSRPLLARNAQFKNRHQGETCYIVGNGASIKNMELGAFSDHVAIGLNMLCLHQEYRALDLRYHVFAEPLILYPYVKNPYTGRYQPNVFGALFREAFSQHPDVALFTSLSNVLGHRFRRVFYLYHFGQREVRREICDIAGAFSFMWGSLYAGIGLAINMGFSKAVLVGCDYAFSPRAEGHFYAAGPPVRSDRYDNMYARLFDEAAGSIDLSLVTDVGESRWLPSRTYSDYTGRPLRYRENTELICADYINMLQQAADVGQYTSPVLTAAPARPAS
jgi:hypothetical protein